MRNVVSKEKILGEKSVLSLVESEIFDYLNSKTHLDLSYIRAIEDDFDEILEKMEKEKGNTDFDTTSFDSVLNFELNLNYKLINTGKTEAKLSTSLNEHKETIITLTQLSDGFLASTSQDNKIKIWNLKNGTCVTTLETKNVRAFAALPKGGFACAGEDNTIRVFDFKNNACHLRFTLHGHHEPIMTLAVLKDNSLISCAVDETTEIWNVKIWNLKNRKGETILQGNKDSDDAVVVFAELEEDKLAAGSPLQIWDLKTRKCIYTFEEKEARDICKLVALSDYRLASISGDQVCLWDVKTFRYLGGFDSYWEDASFNLIVLPNNILAKSSNWDIEFWSTSYTGRIMNLYTGKIKKIKPEYKNEDNDSDSDDDKGRVTALLALPDGRLVVGFKYGAILVWDLNINLNILPTTLTNLRPILTALKKNKIIRLLNLRETQLNDKDIPELINLLKANSGLMEIDISDTDITSQGLKLLAQGLSDKVGPFKIKSNHPPIIIHPKKEFGDCVEIKKNVQSLNSQSLTPAAIDKLQTYAILWDYQIENEITLNKDDKCRAYYLMMFCLLKSTYTICQAIQNELTKGEMKIDHVDSLNIKINQIGVLLPTIKMGANLLLTIFANEHIKNKRDGIKHIVHYFSATQHADSFFRNLSSQLTLTHERNIQTLPAPTAFRVKDKLDSKAIKDWLLLENKDPIKEEARKGCSKLLAEIMNDKNLKPTAYPTTPLKAIAEMESKAGLDLITRKN